MHDQHHKDHDQFADQNVDQQDQSEGEQTEHADPQQQWPVSGLDRQTAQSDQSDRRRSPQTDDHPAAFDPEKADVNWFAYGEHRKPHTERTNKKSDRLDRIAQSTAAVRPKTQADLGTFRAALQSGTVQ